MLFGGNGVNRFLLMLVVVLLPGGVFVALSHGADCALLLENIKKQRNFMTRKTLVEEAFALCPENATVVFKYAFSCERYDKREAALKYYTKAAVLDPQMAKAFFGMGDVYATLGKDDLAVMAYAKGLTLEPTNVRAIRSKTALEAALPKTNPRADVK